MNRKREEKELEQLREDSATLVADLPPLTAVDASMCILHIDITFDDYLSSMQL